MRLQRAIDVDEDAGYSRAKQHQRRNHNDRYQGDDQRILDQTLTTSGSLHKLAHESPPLAETCTLSHLRMLSSRSRLERPPQPESSLYDAIWCNDGLSVLVRIDSVAT